MCGNINYAHGKFWATEHAVVCYPLREIALLWIGELLRAMNLNQYNVSAAQPGLAIERIKNLLIPVPPLAEQEAIAAWLDEKCGEIDAAIAKVDREIELIDELKQSEISRVVTRGLNPDTPLRPSGIDWIGDIPSHWVKCRIKQHYYLKGRIGWQGLKADEFMETGPHLVTGTDFRNGRVDWSLCYHISEERYNEAPEIHVENGDILITKDGTVGKLALIDDKPERVSLNSHLLIIRPMK